VSNNNFCVDPNMNRGYSELECGDCGMDDWKSDDDGDGSPGPAVMKRSACCAKYGMCCEHSLSSLLEGGVSNTTLGFSPRLASSLLAIEEARLEDEELDEDMAHSFIGDALHDEKSQSHGGGDMDMWTSPSKAASELLEIKQLARSGALATYELFFATTTTTTPLPADAPCPAPPPESLLPATCPAEGKESVIQARLRMATDNDGQKWILEKTSAPSEGDCSLCGYKPPAETPFVPSPPTTTVEDETDKLMDAIDKQAEAAAATTDPTANELGDEEEDNSAEIAAAKKDLAAADDAVKAAHEAATKDPNAKTLAALDDAKKWKALADDALAKAELAAPKPKKKEPAELAEPAEEPDEEPDKGAKALAAAKSLPTKAAAAAVKESVDDIEKRLQKVGGGGGAGGLGGTTATPGATTTATTTVATTTTPPATPSPTPCATKDPAIESKIANDMIEDNKRMEQAIKDLEVQKALGR